MTSEKNSTSYNNEFSAVSIYEQAVEDAEKRAKEQLLLNANGYVSFHDPLKLILEAKERARKDKKNANARSRRHSESIEDKAERRVKRNKRYNDDSLGKGEFDKRLDCKRKRNEKTKLLRLMETPEEKSLRRLKRNEADALRRTHKKSDWGSYRSEDGGMSDVSSTSNISCTDPIPANIESAKDTSAARMDNPRLPLARDEDEIAVFLTRHRDHIKDPFVKDRRSRSILHGIDSSSQEFTCWNSNVGGELYNIERPDLNKEHHELLPFDKNKDELEEEKSIKLSEEEDDEKSIEEGDFTD